MRQSSGDYRALIRHDDGDSELVVPLVEGRLPDRVRIPVDDDWHEHFQLDSWEGGRPVYRSMGFTPRVPSD